MFALLFLIETGLALDLVFYYMEQKRRWNFFWRDIIISW